VSVVPREAENHLVPAAANDSWRNWLMTGIRHGPVYRRRVRGAHKGLKRMLVEGMADADDQSHVWKRFSGAMVRQAVDEAVSSLPPRQKQLIKLAYFSDLTNREIAQGLGITLSSVERGLREAIARVSDYVERGKSVGRRAIYAIGLFLAGRQLVKAGVIIVATAAAGAVVSAQPASPAPLAPADRASVPAVTSVQPYVALQRHVVEVAHVTNAVALQAGSRPPQAGEPQVSIPTIALPAVKLPIPVPLPPLPLPPLPLPIRQGLLGA
jgi:DNA-binding CsgD family transcriptional regulator